MSNKDVAAKYGVPKNTLSTWVKSKEKLFAALEKGNNVKRQKLRTWDHETLDTAVFKWFLSLRSQNVPLSGAIIQEKTSQYAKELSIEHFKASGGWLRRWKERNNVTFKTISGESNSVTPQLVNPWSETSLPTLLYNYDLKDIYNADEFGLFYRYVSKQNIPTEIRKVLRWKVEQSSHNWHGISEWQGKARLEYLLKTWTQL